MGRTFFGVLLLINAFWRASNNMEEDDDVEVATNALKTDDMLEFRQSLSKFDFKNP